MANPVIVDVDEALQVFPLIVVVPTVICISAMLFGHPVPSARQIASCVPPLLAAVLP